MKKSSLLLAGLLAVSSVFGEGEVGTQAYQWSLSNIAPTNPTTYNLANYSGKVVLQVVFQYNCGGCTKNAPKLGRLVDTLDRGPDSAKFQAVGTEIATATYAQIQTYRNILTRNDTLTLNFPLVKVPHDTAIVSDATAEKWKRYNSYRDTYFVIGHDGLIKARVQGDRTNAMTNTQYQTLRAALNTALAAVPSSIATPASGASAGFLADRIGRGYRFQRSADAVGATTLRILDIQGRSIRAFVLSAASPVAVWNGMDAAGSPVSFGLYFARTEGEGQAFSRRLPLLP
jgi:peroxiredoxin